MRLLITGGNGKLAKKFKELNGDIVLNPSKEELNLLDTNSILKFYENHKDVDGIILNATLYPSSFHEFHEFFDINILNNLIDAFKLVAIGNQQLINLYKENIRFVINVSSGATNNKRPYGDHFGYKLVKTISNFVIEEYSVNKNKSYDNIKLITFNPSHMEYEKEYESQAELLTKMVNQIDKFKTGKEYYPFNNGLSDINDTHFINIV